MSLSDCIKCYDTPCECGWEYRGWTVERLDGYVKMLNNVIMFKKLHPDQEFSMFMSDGETEADKKLMEYLRRN